MRGTWPTEQPILSDGQVRLRPWLPQDADDVCRACQDPAIAHFTQVPVPYLREHAEGFIANAAVQWAQGTGAQFAVTDHATGVLLGSMSLMEAEREQRLIEAGYWTAPWGRSRGATRRALRLITQWALTQGWFDTVVAKVEQVNSRSAAVVTAVGYRPDEAGLEPFELKGTVRHLVTYRITLAELG